MRLKNLDDRFVPGLARAVQRPTDRLVRKLPKSWQERLAEPPQPPRRAVRRPGGPAPVVVRLREVDDRYASRGPFGLIREVPQLGAFALALVVLFNGAMVFDRRRDARVEQSQEQPGGDELPGAGGGPADDSDGQVGPNIGDDVQEYVDATAAELAERADGDDAGVPVWSVVSFERYVDVQQVAALAAGVRPQFVVLRVPPASKDVPSEPQTVRVQNVRTDLPRELGNVANELIAEADRLEKQAKTIENDPAQKEFDLATARQLRTEAAVLRRGCACMYGLIVKATPRELSEIAARDGVRSVDLGPVGASYPDLTFHVLLPEEQVTVTGGNEGIPGG